MKKLFLFLCLFVAAVPAIAQNEWRDTVTNVEKAHLVRQKDQVVEGNQLVGGNIITKEYGTAKLWQAVWQAWQNGEFSSGGTFSGADSADLYEVVTILDTSGFVQSTKLYEKLNYINIKDFGAVGDGVADDTEAIQDAIYFANTIGYHVFAPEGTYMVTESIVLPSNLTMFGAGKMSIIKAANNFIGAANGRPVMRNESRDSTVIDSNITLLNFTIDGNLTGQSETGDVKCLELIFAKDVKLEGMNFINAYATARLDPGSSGQARGIGVWTEVCEDILITKCTGGNCMYEVIGIRSGSKNIIVTECMFWQPSPKPAAFTGINAIQAGLTGGYESSVSGSDVTPKGILVSNNITINASIDIHHAEQMRVSANYIIPPDSTFGVRVMGYEFDSYDDRIVEGNLINCSSGNIKRGIYIGDNTVATVVQNNKIVNASSSGIEVGNGADQTMVVGNTISTKQKTLGFYGIFCEDRNAIIKNNIIENCYDGIYVDLENPSTLSQGFLNISGNTISNTGRHGIRFNAAPSNVELYKTVANNTIQNISFQGISCSGGKYSLVTGNTVDSASSPTQGMGIALNNEEISIVTNNYVNNIAFRDYAVLNTLGDSVTAYFLYNLSSNGVTKFYNATTGSLVLTDADYLNNVNVLRKVGIDTSTGRKTFIDGLNAEVSVNNVLGRYAAIVQNKSSVNQSQHGLKIIVESGGGAPLVVSVDGGVTDTTFIIRNNGRVGIGTNPTQQFDVNGNVRLRDGLFDAYNSDGNSNSALFGGDSLRWKSVYTQAQSDSSYQFIIDSLINYIDSALTNTETRYETQDRLLRESDAGGRFVSNSTVNHTITIPTGLTYNYGQVGIDFEAWNTGKLILDCSSVSVYYRDDPNSRVLISGLVEIWQGATLRPIAPDTYILIGSFSE